MDPSPSSPSPSGPAVESTEHGKLFVGGISSGTREETLAEYFSSYGEVKQVVVMRDRLSGNCRGFGFVQFVDPEAAERALEDETHFINERPVEVKRAMIRRYQSNAQQDGSRQYREQFKITSNHSNYNGGEINPKKIFVGGLPETLTQEEFKRYFEKFGSVMDTVVMYDNTTQRPRGFGFITFNSEVAVQNVLKNNSHLLNGKSVDVKIAVAKDGSNHRSNQNAYKSQAFDANGQDFAAYQAGFYPQYGNKYGFLPATYAPYVYGSYSYPGYGFGVPFASSRYPWNISYGSAHFYPSYSYTNDRLVNNMNLTFGGYDHRATSVNNQENQVVATVAAADLASSQSEGVSLDA